MYATIAIEQHLGFIIALIRANVHRLARNPCVVLKTTQGGYDPKTHGSVYLLRNGVDAIELAYKLVMDAKARNSSEPVIIMGYSWGGAAALDLATRLNHQTVARGSPVPSSVPIDLLYLVDTELDGRSVVPYLAYFPISSIGGFDIRNLGNDANSRGAPNSVPSNVLAAVNLSAKNPSLGLPKPAESAQNGTDNIRGALNIELDSVYDPGANSYVETNHMSIVWSPPGASATTDFMAGSIYAAIWE